MDYIDILIPNIFEQSKTCDGFIDQSTCNFCITMLVMLELLIAQYCQNLTQDRTPK